VCVDLWPGVGIVHLRCPRQRAVPLGGILTVQLGVFKNLSKTYSSSRQNRQPDSPCAGNLVSATVRTPARGGWTPTQVRASCGPPHVHPIPSPARQPLDSLELPRARLPVRQAAELKTARGLQFLQPGVNRSRGQGKPAATRTPVLYVVLHYYGQCAVIGTRLAQGNSFAVMLAIGTLGRVRPSATCDQSAQHPNLTTVALPFHDYSLLGSQGSDCRRSRHRAARPTLQGGRAQRGGPGQAAALLRKPAKAGTPTDFAGFPLRCPGELQCPTRGVRFLFSGSVHGGRLAGLAEKWTRPRTLQVSRLRCLATKAWSDDNVNWPSYFLGSLRLIIRIGSYETLAGRNER
jgi:hypothetical protein